MSIAAETIGMTEACIYKWLREGRKKDAHPDLVKLVTGIKAARAKGIARRLQRISKAGEKNWQADAWILERTVPEHFSLHKTELAELRKIVAEMEKQARANGSSSGTAEADQGGPEGEPGPDHVAEGTAPLDAASGSADGGVSE
jgi:hypothetical protein